MAASSTAAAARAAAEHSKVAPSEEEIARLRAERKAKKLAEIRELKIDDGSEPTDGKLRFKPRTFVTFAAMTTGPESSKPHRLRLLTWNVLAQALVRRDLFPGSDCLKIAERVPTIAQEIVHYSPDIATLQEVDRLERHNPVLSRAGYSSHVFCGYADKTHSLMIIWKSNRFKQTNFLERRFDELAFSEEAPERDDGQEPKKRLGLSRVTRNVGLAVALEFADGSGGLIVATTHAHWHVRYSRQIGLWLREVRNWRAELRQGGCKDWPIVFAGDLNSQPIDPTYRFLVGAPLTDAHRAELDRSRIVHESVDKLAASRVAFPMPGAKAANDGDDESEASGPHQDEAGDADRVLKGCRPPKPEDGMLSDDELASLYASPMRSAYGRYSKSMREQDGNRFCDRPDDQRHGDWKGLGMDDELDDEGRTLRGDFEPMYTSQTPIWRCLLDYIMLDSPDVDVIGLLPTHTSAEMEPGLPRAGIEPSDHLAIMAELAF